MGSSLLVPRERGDEGMYVMMMVKHTPESCPLYNTQTRKIWQDVMKGYPQLLAKHGVKLVGSWSNFGTHTIYSICDTPGMDAWMGVVGDPGSAAALSFCSAEFFPVMSAEEADAYMNNLK
jgi:hypothetical protein